MSARCKSSPSGRAKRVPAHRTETRSKTDPEPMETLGTGDWCRPESMRSPGTGKAQGAVAALGRKRRLVPWAVWEANEKQMRAAERGQS